MTWHWRGLLPRSVFPLSSPRLRRVCTAVLCSRRCRTPFLPSRRSNVAANGGGHGMGLACARGMIHPA